MAKPWSQVEVSPGFKSLSPQKKVQAKRKYWETVVKVKPEFQSLKAPHQHKAQKDFFGGEIEPRPKTTIAQKVLPQFITGFEPERGQRTLLGDIFERPGAAVRSAIRGEGFRKGALFPEEVPTFQEQSLDAPVNTKIPMTGNKLGDTMSLIERHIKGQARDVGAFVGDIATNPADMALLLAGQTPGARKGAETIARSKGGRAAGEFLTRPRSIKNFKVDRAIDEGISKGIRPSVAGKRTRTQVQRSRVQQREAVKTIVEKKDILKLTDDTGQISNKLPESLDEFSQAVDQTKRSLFMEWDDLAKQAQGQGVSIDLKPVIRELSLVEKSKTMRISNPEVVDYASRLKTRMIEQNRLSVTDADDLIIQYNQMLQAFYKNPNPGEASKSVVNAGVANKLRAMLDDTVSKTTGREFQILKQKYGAVKSIERDVNHRLIVNSRKNIKGLIDMTDIFSGGQIIRGITSMQPQFIAQGVAQKGVASIFKFWNNPNRIVRKMFQEVGKHHTTPPRIYTPEILQTIPVSGLKQIGTQRQVNPALPFRGGSLPSPRDVPYSQASHKIVGESLKPPSVQMPGVIAGQPPFTGSTLPSVVKTPRGKITPDQIRKIMKQKARGRILRSPGEAKVTPKEIREIR